MSQGWSAGNGEGPGNEGKKMLYGTKRLVPAVIYYTPYLLISLTTHSPSVELDIQMQCIVREATFFYISANFCKK